MLLMIYEIQLAGILSLFIGITAILCGITLVRKKRKEDASEDDLGYLENIVSEKGGLEDEEV